MEIESDAAGMRAALAAARRNLRRPDGGPFGACVVKEGQVLAVARLGFRELTISNRAMKRLGGSAVRIVPGVLREECLELLRKWQARYPGTAY